ncbi:MAG TPA: hypothetical protein DDX89_01640 [Candidatus Omnitrophica bacterium]|nr:MAG: hypothetical protein A2Z92_03785 [Omnitrophica WOR_2 bacterium GWA2_63_20]OGX18241.1 MAG: hypothetical protein A2105_05195 [Omnitrophica WOR_2 bacterium GWF2_63_9]OGX30723.1 MAG: hypothetical protein A3E56_02665 [Omnitrophica WOR_2 bacterium RIFCSPHIGHO2_12_FULL_64_13]OGX35020.1 MAG: hypothetical protein A3B73_03700 [Omnitrophica WOR_2 bacterium RIFCSPHIGHO2_02_FULL_63_39]OGX44987.1 MAG: hypothetical protein A3I71_07320 [Omnitrophica WOR_2 bacterium RIFCSPLOWO2_02_FULL_63_16]OGX49619.1
MARWRHAIIVGALAVGCLPGAAWASVELDVLLDKLVQKGVLTKQEASDLRSEMAEFKDAANKQLATEIVPEHARNWQWKGDVRLRDEIRNRVGTGTDLHRQRIRFRYGVEGKVNNQLNVGFRIATGSTSDPISTNQSFNTSFNKKTLILDLAYLNYTPEVPGVSKLSVLGGIMENPLWTVGPMVWDGDLSWDGAAAKLAKELGPVTLFSNNGVFSIDTEETEPSSLWVTQGGLSLKPFPDAADEFFKNLKMTAAVAYHDYKNVANSAKAGTDPSAQVSTNTALVQDFNQWNPNVEFSSKLAGYPLSVFGDWVRNVAAGSGSGNDGFLAGAKIGKATTPWSLTNGWEAGYFFERLEENAVFDEFADSDFGGSGTNRIGNVWWVTLATLKNSTLGVKYLDAHQLTGAKAGEDRIQIDWVTKF